jgi:hypothetical protein
MMVTMFAMVRSGVPMRLLGHEGIARFSQVMSYSTKDNDVCLMAQTQFGKLRAYIRLERYIKHGIVSRVM